MVHFMQLTDGCIVHVAMGERVMLWLVSNNAKQDFTDGKS